METPLPQVLAQHGQFVRALALHLLRDPQLAEDAAQETWLRYLERPPADDGRLRGWLRRVVFNWSANERRGERHRRDVQRKASFEREPAAPTDEAERGELLQRVVAAVVALEEPYRSTLLERYFRGCSAAEVARETNTPLATVRSREQRALAELRARLDRHFGERASWACALLGLVRREPRVAQGEPWLPGSSALQAGIALTIALGGVALWRSVIGNPSPGESTSEFGTRAGALADASEALGSSSGEKGRGDPAPSAPDGPNQREARLGTKPLPGSTQLQAATCEIRGRFLRPGGAPASEVSVELDGYEDQWRSMESSSPRDFEEPEQQEWIGVTDGDGRFSFVFVPLPALAFELDARKPGFARESWAWDQLLPGEVMDVGEIELRPSGALEGRLLDTQGAPILVEGWDVYIHGSRSDTPAGRERFQEVVGIDATTGSYRVEEIPAGRVDVQAARSGSSVIEIASVTIVAGQTAIADITYDGPDLRQRIVLFPTLPSLFDIDPER